MEFVIGVVVGGIRGKAVSGLMRVVVECTWRYK